MKFARLSVRALAVTLTLAACVSSASEPARAPSAAPVPAPTSTSASDEHAALLEQASAAGYKPQKRGGSMVYCRSEGAVGTRFEKTVCLNEAQLAERMRKEAETQQAVRNGRIVK